MNIFPGIRTYPIPILNNRALGSRGLCWLVRPIKLGLRLGNTKKMRLGLVVAMCSCVCIGVLSTLHEYKQGKQMLGPIFFLSFCFVVGFCLGGFLYNDFLVCLVQLLLVLSLVFCVASSHCYSCLLFHTLLVLPCCLPCCFTLLPCFIVSLYYYTLLFHFVAMPSCFALKYLSGLCCSTLLVFLLCSFILFVTLHLDFNVLVLAFGIFSCKS